MFLSKSLFRSNKKHLITPLTQSRAIFLKDKDNYDPKKAE